MGWPPALQFRAEALVPARMAEMTRCIRERDFQAFGQLTMKDSNQFHATCLDTFPPISYLSDTSRRIIQLSLAGVPRVSWARQVWGWVPQVGFTEPALLGSVSPSHFHWWHSPHVGKTPLPIPEWLACGSWKLV